MGRETLPTDGKIVTDNASSKSTVNVSAGDMVSKHITVTNQNFVGKLSGRSRKRAREAAGKRSLKKGPNSRDLHTIKRIREK